MKNNSNKKAPANSVSNAFHADGEKGATNKPPKHHKKPKKVYL